MITISQCLLNMRYNILIIHTYGLYIQYLIQELKKAAVAHKLYSTYTELK